ncbi:MAG: hypothetical protein LiPW15_463 [Parcubacteria group bacterium LiPW_15]|nr:MAG: hypothetical protein LiPW15_463 [Parcubacteria group bacterium LiPW_15]
MNEIGVTVEKRDPERETCGMKFCMFHSWTDIRGIGAAVDSICRLPGDGGNVLVATQSEGDPAQERTAYGVRRLPKCLKSKLPVFLG